MTSNTAGMPPRKKALNSYIYVKQARNRASIPLAAASVILSRSDTVTACNKKLRPYD